MIELTDIDGKVWWVNPTAVSAVTACDHFGKEIGYQRVKTKTYIYIGALENVINMTEELEEVVHMLRGFEKVKVAPWQYATETVTIPPGGQR